MNRQEFKEMLLKMYPDCQHFVESNLGKAAELTAIHCFVYGYLGAGDAKILREQLKYLDSHGKFNFEDDL